MDCVGVSDGTRTCDLRRDRPREPVNGRKRLATRRAGTRMDKGSGPSLRMGRGLELRRARGRLGVEYASEWLPYRPGASWSVP
jgi:hypothetical protein